MNSHAYLEHGMSILRARLDSPLADPVPAPPPSVRPFVTLSREMCAGATTLGRALLPRLDAEFGEDGQEWVLLDKDLLTTALASRELPEQLARYLPEDQVSEIDAVIGEIVGLHPSLWELERQVAHAIVQLAHVGRFVFVGRAAHLLTGSLPGGLHVRLVAARETRVRRLLGLQGGAAREAEEQIERTDNGRRRYVKAHFGRDIDDPHAYDLVINTDRMPPETAARLVVEALGERVRAAAAGPPAAGGYAGPAGTDRPDRN
jgi:cytidylate kinase